MTPKPFEAVFADGTKRARPLAIQPEAIGAVYPTLSAECVADIVDGVAVLCVEGPLAHKCGWWMDYETLAVAFHAAIADSAVSAVVLKFDSPGGDVAGLNETVKLLQEMKKASGKKVIGYVDEACYSAAYALAMVCDEIYLPESGGVGSIGVITALADVTEADKLEGVRIEVVASGSKKTDGHPHVAITDEAIARTQGTVNYLAASFFEIVAESRGLDVETIEGYQAGIYLGQDAVDAGLADGVMSLQECLQLASDLFSSNQPAAVAAKETPMTGKLAAAKALNDATKALAAAKTDAERALAAARIVAAEAQALDAKVMKKKVTRTEVVDDGESDATKKDEEDEDEDEKDEDDEKEEKAAASSHVGAAQAGSLLALARQITGKRSVDEVMGALQGMAASHAKTTALAAKVERLEADAQAGKVSALVSQGLKAGKLAPAQRDWAKAQSPAALKAYLDAAPSMVHTASEEHIEASVAGNPIGAVSAEMARIWKKQGFAETDFPALLATMNGGKSANGAS